MKSADRYFYVNLTFSCNQNCVFCVSDETVSNRECIRRSWLPVEFFEREVRNLPDCIDTIHLSGGEPTLHPDLERIVQIAASRFSRVQIATNGIRLSDKMFVEKLLANVKVQFVIPIFTTDKMIHQRLTGVDSFDDVISGLRNVSELSRQGRCSLSLKLIVLAQTIDSQCSLLDELKVLGVEPSDFIVSGLCRTNGAIDSGCVVPYNVVKEKLSSLARKIIESNKSFCFHRIPLCAFEQDLWPYLMTLDREDKVMEYATAHALYPGGAVKVIPPSCVVNEVCKSCELADWCEYSSNRNGDLYDYSSEFSPIELLQTCYAMQT